MTAENLLNKRGREIYSVEEDVSIYDCVTIMNDKRIGALCVLDNEGGLRGVISERDIMWLIQKTDCQIADSTVKQVMTPKENIISVQGHDHIANVMDKMTKNNIRHIIINEQETLVGLISMRDVIKTLLDNALIENKQLIDYVYQSY